MKVVEGTPSPESKVIQNALETAVKKALDRKRRLGQYAVFWKDGRPTEVRGEDLLKK